MKILFISSSRRGKGISPFIESQKQSLIEYGIEVDSVLITGPGLLNYIKSVFVTRKLLLKTKYEIIHAHYNLVAIVCFIAAINLKIKLIVSFMGDDLYGTYNQNNKLNAKGWFNIMLSRLFIPFYHGIIVKSKRMLSMVNSKHHYKTKVIPNGINFDMFKPCDISLARKRLKLQENQNYVLFLNNMTDPRKNYQLLKQATEHTNSRYDVLTPFPVEHEKVPLFLNAADVLVHISKLEGSSNLIKEALACNCPVISTDVGDAKEHFENICGCHIVDFNRIDVAKQIDLVLKEKKRTDSRSRISYLRTNIIAEEIVELYKIVLEN